MKRKTYEEKFLTVSEAAQMMDISSVYLRKLVRDGQINGFKVGRTWMLSFYDIPTFIRKRKRNEQKNGKSRKSK